MMTNIQYFCFLIFLIRTSTGEVNILLQDVDIHALQTVKVIEGNDLHFECRHRDVNATVIWYKNGASLTISKTLYLKSISRIDGGYYTCSVTFNDNSTILPKFENKTVFVNILYPPSDRLNEFPSSLVHGDIVSLTYLVDSEPEPTYNWTIGKGISLSRNKTYRITVPYDGFWISCKVKSLMIPTVGEAISFSSNESKTYIRVQRRASIVRLKPWSYVYNNPGENSTLECEIDGHPTPKVWWTKTGDDSFHQAGPLYHIYDVDYTDEGEYVCNVENTVLPFEKPPEIVYRTKSIHLFVNGKHSDEQTCKCTDCLKQCSSQSNFRSSTASISTVFNLNHSSLTDSDTSASTEVTTVYVDDSKENDSVFPILITAAILGWIVSLIMIVLNIYLCKYMRTKAKYPEQCNRQNTMEGNVSNRSGNSESTYVSNVRLTDHHYTDLTIYDQINSSRNASSNQNGDESMLDFTGSESVSTQISVITN